MPGMLKSGLRSAKHQDSASNCLSNIPQKKGQSMQPDQKPPESLWGVASSGIMWSLAQTGGGRVLTFCLSILLARLLSPSEYGVAAAAALIIGIVPMLAEFGFGSAIIQRKNLQPYEVNLPFYASIFVAVMLVILVIAFIEQVGRWVDADAVPLYVVLSTVVILLNLPSSFQEAMYKRALRFKSLAFRRLTVDAIAGGAAIGSALWGLGVWSFLIQAYVASILGAIWLWSYPQWLPTRKLDVPSFRSLSSFGLPVVIERLREFLSTRLIDVLIVGQLGVAAYGIYAVGARIYQLMLELLQGTLYDASLSVLSKISNDRKRLAEAYIKTISISSHVMTPIFVMLAALSPEISSVLYGEKWQGVDRILLPLLLLGGIQCVQHMNGAFLSARGKPQLVLVAGMTKTVLTVVGLLFMSAKEVSAMAVVFVICQALAAPVSYAMTWRELEVSRWEAFRILLQSAVMCGLSFLCVVELRPLIASHLGGAFLQGMVLGVLFCSMYLSLLWLIDREKAYMTRNLIMSKVRK